MNKNIINKKTYRDFKVDSGNIDKENRLVKIAFSSENPVERFFGNEILSHEQGAVDMSRLLDGAPLLLDHDSSKVIGVVENAKIDSDKIGRAIVRFSRSPEAETIFQDVIDGIRKKISVGYIINEIVEVAKKSADTIQSYLATNWTPLEVSIVGIPADSSVGVGRSEENFEEENQKEKINNIIKINNERSKKMDENKNVVTSEDVIKNERERVNEIEATSKKFVGRVANVDELRTNAIRNGWTSEQFKASVADKLSDGKPFETPKGEIGLSEKEKKRYSILNLILSQVPNTGVKAEFERELSNEVVRKTGKAPRGLYLPYDIQTRDLLAGSGTGANIVGTQLQPQSFIEYLYNAQIATKLGAQRLSGLNQNVAIPKLSGKSTVGWVSENSATSETAPTFSQVTLSPKTVGAYVDYSRNLLMQGLPSIENLVMQDLATSIGLAVDAAMLHGSGASGQPTGIENTSGIGGVTITSNTVTWANLLEFETDVLTANADASKCAFITTPAIAALLKSKVKISGDSRSFAFEDGKVNGFPVYISNQVSSGYCFFGNFSDAILGEWGNGVDLLVDSFSLSTQGAYRICSFYSTDIGIRHAGSFSMASGITA